MGDRDAGGETNGDQGGQSPTSEEEHIQTGETMWVRETLGKEDAV